MNIQIFAVMLAMLMVFPAMGVEAAGPGDAGSPFSDAPNKSNIPAECQRFLADGCYHMKGGLNALDSPVIDVLLVVPASPYAERDLRAMHQVVDMYDAGIKYIADQEGMGWLAHGLEFHVTPMVLDPATGTGGEFTTYPIVDPEIVVFRGNPFFVPVGLGAILGIGIDPLAGIVEGPCHGIQNPFDFEYWENLDGFDSHHDGRSGTYTEDCDGAGGNVCFSVNGGLEPLPGADLFGINVFDLVAHEIGHCLRLGHVGDAGTEFSATNAPLADIMSYAERSFRKCVSSLDVETFAVAMSPFLDVNGDGEVSAPDQVYYNDHIGHQGSPFQVQHPDDHYYASSTGDAKDCPQPDLGLLPGEPVDFCPQPGACPSTSEGNPAVVIASPGDGATLPPQEVAVSGSVSRTQGGASLTASAGGDYSGTAGQPIAITGSAFGGASGEGYTCQWTGDSASFADANECQTTVTYEAPGDHAITLSVDDGSDEDTDDADVSVTTGGFPTTSDDIQGGIRMYNLGLVDASGLIATVTGPAGDPVPKYVVGDPVAVEGRSIEENEAILDPCPDGETADLFIFDGDANIVHTQLARWGYTPATTVQGQTVPPECFIRAGEVTLDPSWEGRHWLDFKMELGGETVWLRDSFGGDPSGLKPIDIVGAPSPDASIDSLTAQPAPTQPPQDPHIEDATGDVGVAGAGLGLPLTSLDIEAAWFEQDTENLYVGMKVADIPADATTTAQQFYEVGFKPVYAETWPGVPADGPVTTVTFTGLRVLATLAPVDASVFPPPVETRFELHYLYRTVNSDTGATSNTYAAQAALLGSMDAETDIIWWVVPRAHLSGDIPGEPQAGSRLTELSAETGLVLGVGTLGGSDTATGESDYVFADDALVADAGGPYNGNPGQPIAVAGSASGGLGGASCSWSTSDDGMFADAASCATTVTFATPGGKTVTLTVTEGADSDTDDAAVTVSSGGGERVDILVDDELHDMQPVDTATSDTDDWSGTVDLSGMTGQHTITANWYDADETLLDMHQMQVTVQGTGDDTVAFTSHTDSQTVSDPQQTFEGTVTPGGAGGSSPTATIQEESLAGQPGDTLSFSATVTGDPAPTCTWSTDGSATVTPHADPCTGADVASTTEATETITLTATNSFGTDADTATAGWSQGGDPLTATISEATRSGDTGTPLSFTATVAGGSGPYACTWSASGDAVASGDDCTGATFTSSTAGVQTVTLDVSDSADGTAQDTATAEWFATGPTCTSDAAGDAVVPTDPLAADPWDIVDLCHERTAVNNVVTMQIAGGDVQDFVGTAASPVMWTVVFDDGVAFDMYKSLISWTVYRYPAANGCPEGVVGGATVSAAGSAPATVTLTIPNGQVCSAGDRLFAYTHAGEPVVGFSPNYILGSHAVAFDRAPDSGALALATSVPSIDAVASGPDPDKSGTEHVALHVAGGLVGSAEVDTSKGSAGWSIPATLSEGANAVLAEWYGSDGALRASATIEVVLDTSNTPPVLDPIGDKTVQEGQELSFTVTASDADGDPLSFTMTDTSIPADAFTDNTGGTATFAWTPGEGSAGNHDATFTVSDGQGGTDVETITVTVETSPNEPPTASAGEDQTVYIDDTVTLAGSCHDSDGAIASCAWSQFSGPSVVIEQEPDGTGSFVPAEAGTLVLRLTATDDDGATHADDLEVVVLTPSSIKIVSPSNDEEVPGTVSVSGTAAVGDEPGAQGMAMQASLPSAPDADAVDPADWQRAIRMIDEEVAVPAAHSHEDLPMLDGSPLIGPGSPILVRSPAESTSRGLCTANFVWQSGAGEDMRLFLGAAGHCFFLSNTATATSYDTTHGVGRIHPGPERVTTMACLTDCLTGGLSTVNFNPTGQWVTLGHLAYARQSEANDANRVGNDFGLVEIPRALWHLVSPGMPVWGGPFGEGDALGGEFTVHYGNAIILGETVATKARAGIAATQGFPHPDAWVATHPAAQGDSGSAVNLASIDQDGILRGTQALGVLTHLSAGISGGIPYATAGTTTEKAAVMALEAGLEIELVDEGVDFSQGGPGGLPAAWNNAGETWYLHRTGASCAAGNSLFIDQEDSTGDLHGCGGAGTGPVFGSSPLAAYSSQGTSTVGFAEHAQVDARIFLTANNPATMTTRVILRADGFPVGDGQVTALAGPGLGYTEFGISFLTYDRIEPEADLALELYVSGSPSYFVGYEGDLASRFTVRAPQSERVEVRAMGPGGEELVPWQTADLADGAWSLTLSLPDGAASIEARLMKGTDGLASDIVTVTVVGDGDGDGLPNDDEAFYGRDPDVDDSGSWYFDPERNVPALPPRAQWTQSMALSDRVFHAVGSQRVMAVQGEAEAPGFSWVPGFGSLAFASNDGQDALGAVLTTPTRPAAADAVGLTSVECDGTVATLYVRHGAGTTAFDVECGGDWQADTSGLGKITEIVVAIQGEGSLSFGQVWMG